MLAFDRDGLTCVVHFGDERMRLDGDVVLASDPEQTAVWVKR